MLRKPSDTPPPSCFRRRADRHISASPPLALEVQLRAELDQPSDKGVCGRQPRTAGCPAVTAVDAEHGTRVERVEQVDAALNSRARDPKRFREPQIERGVTNLE